MSIIIKEIFRKISFAIDEIYEKKHKYLLARHYDRVTEARLKTIGGGYNGSKKEFNETVVKYWSKYGIKPKKFCYDFFCAGKSKYDPRYIPNSLYVTEIIPYFNNMPFRDAYVDKAMFNRLLPNVKKPLTVVKNVAGYYYNGDKEELITREEAEKLCWQEEHLIIKPFRSSKGAGIVFYDKNNKTSPSIRSIFDTFGSGFVAQRIIKQHSVLANINKNSVNTVRVVTFHFKGKVHILSTVLRMGGTDSRVDNIAQGGRACPIKPDGYLQDRAVDRKSVWYKETPGGIKYSDIQIPNFNGVIETAKRLHLTLPYFNIIGWDFAVDEAGDPVFIEFNGQAEQNQISCGPTFGDMTEEVLEEVFIKKTLKDVFVKKDFK